MQAHMSPRPTRQQLAWQATSSDTPGLNAVANVQMGGHYEEV